MSFEQLRAQELKRDRRTYVYFLGVCPFEIGTWRRLESRASKDLGRRKEARKRRTEYRWFPGLLWPDLLRPVRKDFQ
ncbi:MAG: hypothetical protein ACI97A_003044 [Planctomycetota bacterium]|jgi:hypothetical protein